MTVLKIDFKVNGVNQLTDVIPQPYLAASVTEEQTVQADIAFLTGLALCHLMDKDKIDDDVRVTITVPFDTPDHRAIALLLHKAHVYLLAKYGDYFDIGLNTEERYFTFKQMPKEA